MYKIYDKWPDLARDSYDSTNKTFDFKNIDHVVFAGMGGSGTINELLSSIFSQTKIHVCVVKGYHLPKTVNTNTLVVTTSISGNTDETLTVLDSAKKVDCNLIAFCSGGKMQDYCIKNKINYVKVNQVHSPRSSLPTFLYSMLHALDSVIPIKKDDVLESIKKMENTQKNICSQNLSETNLSLDLAKRITNIPIIYYPWGLQAAAFRFKNSLQENAKFHAMAEDVIEACHNNIVSWERLTNVKPILLEGIDDHPKTKERWVILKEYFKKNNIDFREVFSVEGNILTKLINLIYMLDYSSIYLAVISKTDPTPVNSIDFIKSKLSP